MDTETIRNPQPAAAGEGEAPASEDMHEMKAWIKQRGNELGDAMKEKVRDMGEQTRQATLAKLRAYQKAFNSAAQSLEEEGEDTGASVLRQAADQIGSSAGSLQETSPEELIETASDQVRRAPLLALGGLFVAGFVASRWLAPSEDDQDNPSNEDEEFRGSASEEFFTSQTPPK